MASAVLASRDEGHWGERKLHMRKYTYTPNLSTRFNPNQNLDILTPASNLNPNSSFRQIHEPSPTARHLQANEPSPRPVPPPAVPETSPPFSRKPVLAQNKYVSYNLAEFSKRQKKELKSRLILDLHQVRSVLTWIETRQSQPGPVAVSRPPPVLINPHEIEAPPAPGEKRTPRGSGEQRTPRGFARSKGKGKKRGPKALALSSNRGPKRAMLVADSSPGKVLTSMMRKCSQILTKLIKHKYGLVFEAPVDVEGLGLRDYYDIIKNPMDLGTVKSRLGMSIYETPLDFAADVRLTFTNAMTYNPKGHHVHSMAEFLLRLFEEMFVPAIKKYEAEMRRVNVTSAAVVAERQLIHLRTVPQSMPMPIPMALPAPMTLPFPEPMAIRGKLDKMPPQSNVQVQNGKSTVSVPVPPMVQPNVARKLPKPKARDPNKREMTDEEKLKLGDELQNLPEDKLQQTVQIVRKRNPFMMQEGDEIELDIEGLDNETLWELDRFIGYHKKAMSKLLRQGLTDNSTQRKEIQHELPRNEPVVEEHKKVDIGEEDVDIGEEIPACNFPPVEIERDEVGDGSGSSSSSSSSSSGSDSSSSDSDAGSGSGSDSDEDSVQSPFVDAKRSPAK